MVQYRKLNEDEKKIAEKQVKRLEGELEYQQYLLNYANLMIGQGLYQNYKKQLKEYRGNKREAAGQIQQMYLGLSTLKLHLTKGVEMKAEVKEENGK